MAQWAGQCTDWDEWDKPGPPFKVYGNTYYVGTCGISAILIAGDAGHVLIDGGPENAADIVAANIRALGFELADVKLIVMSHEHHDHAGGIARLQQLTGARLLTSTRAAEAMTTGKATANDPQLAEGNTLPPARVDGRVLDGMPVALGPLRLIPMVTPGHTPGATSWQWRACEGPACKTVVYADSLTPVSSDNYRFSDHVPYLAEFRRSLARVAQLDCDILLAPHPSSSGMRDKLIAGDLTAEPTCRDYAAALTQRLDARLAEEAGGD